MRYAAALLLLALLSGCGSSPKSHFHMLDSIPPAHPAAAVRGAPITVDAVHLPDLLDRREMVRRRSPTELEISDTERWGAPLDDMSRRVLSEDLARRLPPGMIIPPDTPQPTGLRRALVVTIEDFTASPSGDVRLAADWTLLAGTPSHPVLRRHEAIEVGDAGSFTTQPAAMSRALAELADRIVAALAIKGAGS